MSQAHVSWKRLPGGLYASSCRTPHMYKKDSAFFSLSDAANMDVVGFNKNAGKYGIHMDEKDLPVTRMAKYNIFLSRSSKDGSFIPSNKQYVDMLVEVAGSANKGNKEMQEFLKILKNGPAEMTTDVLSFKELIASGSNKGKYVADLLRFDESGELIPADDGIMIAPEGYQVMLDLMHRLPVETSKSKSAVAGIDEILPENDRSGYWYVGSDPVGQKRIVLRAPAWAGDWLLDASADVGLSCSYGRVGALRLRVEMPK